MLTYYIVTAERIRKKPGWHEAAKTHCPQGHPYDQKNTHRWGGKRYCRTCNNALPKRRGDRPST